MDKGALSIVVHGVAKTEIKDGNLLWGEGVVVDKTQKNILSQNESGAKRLAHRIYHNCSFLNFLHVYIRLEHKVFIIAF